MSHKKAGGSSRNGRDSNGQRRGVKRYSGQKVNAGSIIVAKIDGIVAFERLGRDRKKVSPPPTGRACFS